jgi:hypothetical protein
MWSRRCRWMQEEDGTQIFATFPPKHFEAMLKWIPALLFLLPLHLAAQLLPSIGLSALPADTAAICSVIPYTGAYDTTGYNVGDTVPDFTLYTVAGTPVTLSSVLQGGLPVLLVSASYTCPVFRGKIAELNRIDSIYQGQLKVYVVYTLEAHPIVDLSPYSGTLWTTAQNQQAGILFQQPTTYGERKALIDSMTQAVYLRPEVVVDGPCNPWWHHYGPAPNNATLIQPDGRVFAKHDWFHRSPLNSYCDIDSLLGTNSGQCLALGNSGQFTFTLDRDSVVFGNAGDVLALHGLLSNTSTTDNVVLDIAKLAINVPAGWTTALCADICYPVTTAQTQLILAPMQVQPFTFYFYTDAIPATGDVRVGFRNNPFPNNRYQQGFYANTLPVGLVAPVDGEGLRVFPQPASGAFTLRSTFPFERVVIRDMMGKVVWEQAMLRRVDEVQIAAPLPAGCYLLIVDGDVVQQSRLVMVR